MKEVLVPSERSADVVVPSIVVAPDRRSLAAQVSLHDRFIHILNAANEAASNAARLPFVLPEAAADKLVSAPDEWSIFNSGVKGKFDSQYDLFRFWVGPDCQVVNFSRHGALLCGEVSTVQAVRSALAMECSGRCDLERVRMCAGVEGWVRKSEVQDPGCVWSEYLTPENIIRPSDLAGKVRNVDYVLLMHRTEPRHVESIRRQGLRSFADLAGSPGASPEMVRRLAGLRQAKVFTNDPDLVYFRPLIEGSAWKVEPEDFVIAVDLSAAFAYHSAFRITATSKSDSAYVSSRVHVSELISQYSSRLKGISSVVSEKVYADAGGFVPECCVRTGRIAPEMFVSSGQHHF